MKEMFLDLAKYRIQRALESKQDAELLLKGDQVRDAVNRIFTANYYAVKSFLATKMVDSTKQQQVLQAFYADFVQAGEIPKEYGQIVEKSYHRCDEGERRENLSNVSREQALELVAECERFIDFAREYIAEQVISDPQKSGQSSGDQQDRNSGSRRKRRR